MTKLNKLTDKQLGEFWEWCGFKVKETENIYHDPITVLLEPKYGCSLQVGEPKLDLNNLFKYAIKEDWDIHLYFDKISQTHDCVITLPDEREFDGSGDTREDALFQTVQNIMKRKN